MNSTKAARLLYMGARLSNSIQHAFGIMKLETQTSMPEQFAGVVIGIVGTGMMATAHAARWSTYSIPIVIGSRDPSRAKQLARRIGRGNVSGVSHEEMLSKANFIFLCTPAGAPAKQFVEKYAKQLSGKGICEMSASYSRWSNPSQRAPAPYQSQLTWLSDVAVQAGADADSTTWVKAFCHVNASSISNNKQQPMEITGDGYAKKVVIMLLNQAGKGWEVLDIGPAKDSKYIEGRGPARRQHPRYVEFNGNDAP